MPDCQQPACGQDKNGGLKKGEYGIDIVVFLEQRGNHRDVADNGDSRQKCDSYEIQEIPVPQQFYPSPAAFNISCLQIVAGTHLPIGRQILHRDSQLQNSRNINQKCDKQGKQANIHAFFKHIGIKELIFTAYFEIDFSLSHLITSWYKFLSVRCRVLL